MSGFFTSPYWSEVQRALARVPPPLLGAPVWILHDTITRRLLGDRVLCIRQACDLADIQTQQRLSTMLAGLQIDQVLHELLDALKEAVLIVGASVGVGGALGAGVGSLVFGVGAVPGGAIGAAVGAKVGLWILAALGLKSLAEFFIEGLPAILQDYYRGFTVAWQARCCMNCSMR